MPIIDFVKRDCADRGRGGKKWWAHKLGISQMTLSHWLTGRRQPNASHLNAIYVAREEFEASKQKSVWLDLLWQSYYENKGLDGLLLKTVGLHLMKADGLQSRNLALLSWLFEKYEVPSFEQAEVLTTSHWNNKIGWLYESAGLGSRVNPIQLKAPATLLETNELNLVKSENLRLYFERQQTDLGRKWFLYDCPLDHLKEKLGWRQ